MVPEWFCAVDDAGVIVHVGYCPVTGAAEAGDGIANATTATAIKANGRNRSEVRRDMRRTVGAETPGPPESRNPYGGRSQPYAGGMTERLRTLPRRTLAALRRHPVVTTLFVLGSVAWLAFGLIIGGAPFFAITLLALAGLSWVALTLLRRRRAQSDPDAELTPDAPTAPTSGRRDGLVVVGVVAVTALVLFGLIQLIPFGHPQTYTAGSGEPAWATPRTRELMAAACFDCHSNEIEYPWYSSIAPVSWTVQHHIDEGREAVNYSEFATNPGSADETVEVIRDGSMPPGYFTAFGMHPEAKLSEAEKAELIAGLEATPGLQDRGDRD